jgi:hypothetical protein
VQRYFTSKPRLSDNTVRFKTKPTVDKTSE